jgi:two-component system phosphate regulon sensor histidine kinase PhoR
MKFHRIHIVTMIILVALIGLMIVQGYILGIGINAEKERFEELAGKIMLDIHHNVEDDRELSAQLIKILSAYEKGKEPAHALIGDVISEMGIRIDSICMENGISLHTDFVIYRTKDLSILLDSRQSRDEEIDITEHSVKAGWRIREELGEGKYRIGLIFYQQYLYLLREMSVLFLFSGLLLILLMVSVSYTLRNWRLQKDLSIQKNDFINNLTHELKTPIFSASLLHKVIRGKMKDNHITDLQKYLSMLESENEKLKRQVDNVLEIAQLDHGRLKMVNKECDVHRLIKDNLEGFNLLASQKSGKVITKLNAERAIVKTDSQHLTNVLFNLVDNGVKYNRKVPLIVVETSNIQDRFKITVSDNGIGISGKNRELIFEKFFRVNTGNIHPVKGSGLGLSYVKMVVEEFGGTIQLNSTPGKGTNIEITLPVAS